MITLNYTRTIQFLANVLHATDLLTATTQDQIAEHLSLNIY